MLNGK
jgi:hypothetical protein